MQLIHETVDKYIDGLSRFDHPVLEEMEARGKKERFPIVGPAAGRTCYQLSRMIGAKRIFELGSGFGYSTLWFALAVQANGGGEVHHTVWDEQLSTDARGYLERAGVRDIVRFHVSEAVVALQETEGLFDVIFNDIGKSAYPDSIDVIKEKLRPGGLLIMDNMLWSGRIFDDADVSASTEGVRESTRRLFADDEFVSTMLPIRDGLLVALRVG